MKGRPGEIAAVATVATACLTYIIVAILLHPEDSTPDYHFYSERGLITGLSAVFLASAGALAMATLFVNLRNAAGETWTWVLLTLGFYFLALDEVAQFHERVGDILDSHTDSGVFRNWNDIIVISYGVIAIPVAWFVFPTLLRYAFPFKLMVTGFVLYAVHTMIDSMVEDATVVSIIAEESAKLFCGATLALAMFFCFISALWKSRA